MTLCAIGLTDSNIIVGNSANVGTDVAMSGDVTIDKPEQRRSQQTWPLPAALRRRHKRPRITRQK